MKETKALALLSGGLDSTLASKLIHDQGINVIAVNFTSPFCLCRKGGCGAPEVAKQLGVPLKMISMGKDYLKMVRNPKHGYGKNMNPCIDCRIFMLKQAKKYAKQIHAIFIFTGEVLDQRPMSQHYQTLLMIEKEAGLENQILRPLSAKLLPMTLAERKGFVDRNKLLGIRGRSRKEQLSLAARIGITNYPCPAGGCLLTEKEFAARLRDLFAHSKRVDMRDMALLKIGRHFRVDKNKIIVGRNVTENELLLDLKSDGDYVFEVPECGSPTTLLEGTKTAKAIQMAASLTAYYSDAKTQKVAVSYGKKKLDHVIEVSVPDEGDVVRLRIQA